MQIKDVSRRWGGGADTQHFLVVAKLCKKQDHNQNASVANRTEFKRGCEWSYTEFLTKR